MDGRRKRGNMYNDVRLDKGFYNITGKTFTQVLTELDPDEGYRDSELAGLDAFERQLKRFDIKVSGERCDTVEKFFATTQSAVLFPEYIRRMVKKGIESACIADGIFAAVGHIDGMDFRSFYITVNGSNPIAQNIELPTTEVKLANSSDELKKFAGQIKCSYEAIRKQRLDAFGVIVREMGARIGRSINIQICSQLSAGITPTTTADTSITYADLATFWGSMTNNNMDVMICPPALMAEILALPEMKYCVSDYMVSGRVKTPYGVTIIKCSQADDDTIIGLDSTAAAELILGTDIIVDHNKIINKQSEDITASILANVSKLTTAAIKVLKVRTA